MPLDQSGSKASIGKNIKTELAAGKPKKQALAIGLNVARENGAKIPKPKHDAVSMKPKMKKNIPAPMLGVYKKKM